MFLLRFTLTASSHLLITLPSYLFLSGFLTQILFALPFFLLCATCCRYLIVLDLIILIINDDHLLWNPLYSPVTSPPSGWTNFLSTVSSDILSACSSLSHKYYILASYCGWNFIVLFHHGHHIQDTTFLPNARNRNKEKNANICPQANKRTLHRYTAGKEPKEIHQQKSYTQLLHQNKNITKQLMNINILFIFYF
jgi:hypothetical protein